MYLTMTSAHQSWDSNPYPRPRGPIALETAVRIFYIFYIPDIWFGKKLVNYCKLHMKITHCKKTPSFTRNPKPLAPPMRKQRVARLMWLQPQHVSLHRLPSLVHSKKHTTLATTCTQPPIWLLYFLSVWQWLWSAMRAPRLRGPWR